MRFSKNKYPILDNISNFESLFKFQEKGLTEKFFYDNERGEEMLKDVANCCDLVVDSKTIDFVSVPFFEKVTTGKVFDKLTHLFCKIDPCEGVLLYPKKRFSKIHAASYLLFPDPESNEMLAEIHLYSEVGRIVVLYVQIKEETTNWRAVISTSIKESNGKNISQSKMNDWFTNHIQTCFSILTFKQFAEIEVKEIGGKDYPKKSKIGKEKYLNESDNQINILDSRWFTETIRSEGFAVSGHFRLQPYGEGMNKRKLIYIEDFLKTGYTSRAKIKSSINN